MSALDNARMAPRIGLSEEQAQLLDIAEAFCRDKSPIDKVRALIDDDAGFDAALWQEIAELGWLGIGVPENYGGIGLGMGELVPLVEHMGRHLMNTPFVPTILFRYWTNSSEIKCDISPTSEKSNRVFSSVNDEIFSFSTSLSIAVDMAARVPPMQYPEILSLLFGYMSKIVSILENTPFVT